MTEKIKLLINLPPTFHTDGRLQVTWQRLAPYAEIRTTSHDTLEQILPDLPWAEAILMWAWPELTEAHLKTAPGLRFLGQINTTKTTVKACLNCHIAQSEVRGCWSPAVAEMALLLMMDGLRRVSEFHMQMRAGTEPWIGQFPADIDGRERRLAGRTVGIIGFGGIGQHLAGLLKPFNVRLLAHDPFLPEEVFERHQAMRTGVDEMVRAVDVLVLAATNHENARGILGRAQIEALPKDAVLVNIGRSMLVDMPALAERLGRGDLIAMLDVFDQEPLPLDSPLRSLPNTYLTPHRAGGLMQTITLGLGWLIDDLEAHLAGKPLRFGVTEAQLPSFP